MVRCKFKNIRRTRVLIPYKKDSRSTSGMIPFFFRKFRYPSCFLPSLFNFSYRIDPKSSPFVAITFLYQSNDFFLKRFNVPFPWSSRST